MVNVLVVEDDEKLNKIVCGSLKSRGYAATGCLSAVAALEKMGEEKFDIVVSDVMMPGKDGFEFAEEVRAADKDIPVIFMTALGDLPSNSGDSASARTIISPSRSIWTNSFCAWALCSAAPISKRAAG